MALCFLLLFGFIQFPDLKNNIKGEENGTFSNSLGETANIEITETIAETSECLLKLLNGDNVAAELLAEEVHKDVSSVLDNIPDLPEGFNFSNMGIWIDPIGKVLFHPLIICTI